MAIEKTIDINVNSSEAIKDVTLLNSVLEEQEQITIELLREQQKLEQQLRDTPKNSLAAQKKLTTELNHVKDSIKDQNLSVKQLKVQQKSLGKGTNDLTNNLVSNGGAMGILNNLTGGLAQQFKDSYEAISLSSKGLGGFKKAMLATGIGALVLGVGLLVANFDEIKDFLSGITAESKAAREALEAEAEALNQTIAKQTTRLQSVARAYESGALKGENLKNVVDDLNEKYEDANLELDENNNLTEDSLAFIDNQIKAIKVQARNKAILTNIEALYSDELQAQTLIGRQNNKFMVERAKLTELLAKKEAGGINSTQANILNKKIAASEKRQKSITNEIISLTNQRAKIQNAIDKETKRLDFTEFSKPKKRSKGSGKGSGKSAEDIAKEEARIEADKLKKLDELKSKIRDESANTEGEARALKLQKIREHNLTLLQEAKDAGLKSQELEDSLDEKLAAKQAEFDRIDEERRKKKEAEDAASRLKKQQEKISELELKKELEELTFQEQRDLIKEREALLLEDTTLTTEQNLALKKSYSDASIDIAKKESDAKKQALDDYAGALSTISGVIGQETEAGKAIAIASSLVNTYAAITGQLAVFSTKGAPPIPGYAIAQAIATGVVGLANVKKIASVKIPNSKGGGGGAGAGSLPSAGAASAPPAFNVVGASDTSQLADAIGGQSQQPIQTYVVSNDVTTAQSLQNSIVEGATIG
tara:strand:+ start:228 stop:2351 length:2124 start_codon:yes stop_codon:yes gene_type:complete